MTLDQMLDKAARALDDIEERTTLENIRRMVEDGVSEDLMQDWLDYECERYAEWRAAALAEIREVLLDPSGWQYREH